MKKNKKILELNLKKRKNTKNNKNINNKKKN